MVAFLRRTYLFFTLLAVMLVQGQHVAAQITLTTTGATAIDLANALAGTGVTILSPTLTCNSGANAIFRTGVTDPIGVPDGIALITGDVTAITSAASVGPESSFFTPSLSDAALSALAGGGLTNDACVLEFDFRAAGDTVKFDYVFASEEYPEFACSEFNDVFGFLISGGVTSPLTSYPVPTNIARIPGTNIPVCINSVNSAPLGTAYPVADCALLGPGSPFAMYYIDNSTSTGLVFDGKTTVLTAIAAVSPCDTYHLKLGIADIGDNAYNSGVFIKGGSLTSTVPDTVVSSGAGGTNYVVRGCAPGYFYVSIPVEQDTDVVRRFNITGTAVNGYDYATIADSIVIPAGDTTASIAIVPLPVVAGGPKTVTIEILKEEPCRPGEFAITARASLTILDSFGFKILTPDTAICAGQTITLRAIGDTVFALNYVWSPAATLGSPTTLFTTATPVVTTTYTLTGTVIDTTLGCLPQYKTVTVSMVPNPVVDIDSALINTCLGIPVDMHAYVTPPGVPYTYSWSPSLGLSSVSTPSTTVTPTLLGDITYTVTVYPTALPACATTRNITVHTVPNDYILNTPDTVICAGEYVQISITGSPEFNWKWRPPVGVSDTNVMEPVITPTVAGVYTVIASYARCPDMIKDISIEIDTPAPLVIIYDTICLPMSYYPDLTVPGTVWGGSSATSGFFTYRWNPATYLTSDTIPNPVITPTVAGSHVYTVTVKPRATGCAVNDIVNLYVLPNTIDLLTPDTAICLGQAVQIAATAHPLFQFQWLPTAGVPLSTALTPLITPDTSAMYKIKVSFHRCPDFYDSLYIDVQPVPDPFVGGSRQVCEYDTVRLLASVDPGWYTNYTYSWAPGTYLNTTSEPSVVLTGGVDQTIILTVSTPAGCVGIDSTLIKVHPANFASIVPELSFCPRDSAVLMPEGGASYEWMPATYLSDGKAAQPVIKPVTDQAYTVLATSADGCKDTLYFMARVHAGAVINMPDSVRLHPGESYQIITQSNCTDFSWSPVGGLSSKYVSDPLASPTVSTKYVVNAMTEHGCKVRDSINVIVDESTIITVPNAFSPGDNVNGEFKIIKRGIATLNYFRIFNRWGNLIFETTNIDEGWKGDYNGVPQQVGVYVYVIEATTNTGKIIQKQGNVTLLR